MTSLIVAGFMVVILMLLLALFWAIGSHSVPSSDPPCKVEMPTQILDPQVKSEVESLEKDVFAKADLIQKMAQEMAPLNGAPRVEEPADPASLPPDETGYMKAITDKVEQIKRLAKR